MSPLAHCPASLQLLLGKDTQYTVWGEGGNIRRGNPEHSDTVVTEVKFIYFQKYLVDLALAWGLQQAAERLWKPVPLPLSGLNLPLLHLLLLLLLLMLRELSCTRLYLCVSSVKYCHCFLKIEVFVGFSFAIFCILLF